ncbi:MAG: hypothetical protein AB7F19_05055 [Candidatus Babeliales bacterium]
MYQKKLYLLSFLFLFSSLTHSMETPKNHNLAIAAWAAATLGIQLVPKLFNTNHYSKKLEEKTNLTIHDIAATATLSTTLLAASYTFSTDRRNKIQYFALRFPIAAMLSKLITCKSVKQSTQSIPILSWYLGCPNEQCNGQCNSCTLRNMIIFTGLIRVLI